MSKEQKALSQINLINKRSIGICIVLSIVTLGIYFVYWEYLLVKNIRAIQKDDSSCTKEMLCLILVPFYNLYWWFTRGKIVKDELTKQGYSVKGNEVVYLILAILGLDIVSAAIMQDDFNLLELESSRSNHKAKKIALIVTIIICSILCITCTTIVLIKNLGPISTEKTYENTRESFAPDLTIGVTTENGVYVDDPDGSSSGNGGVVSDPSAKPVDNKVDFKGLREQNPDVYSWIYIPDTNVSLPVLQSSENDNYYLDHDVYKNYSFPGAIYSQSMNKKDYSDRVTVLYGHNMANGSMFANLHLFADKSFFDSHKYIYIYTPDRRLTYEVVSAHEYDDKHILNSYDFKKDSVFQNWINAAQNPHSLYSNVRKDVKLDLNSKMLVLSTCLNSGDGRFLVQGVLIKDEKTK